MSSFWRQRMPNAAVLMGFKNHIFVPVRRASFVRSTHRLKPATSRLEGPDGASENSDGRNTAATNLHCVVYCLDTEFRRVVSVS